MESEATQALTDLPNVGHEMAGLLARAGISTPEELARLGAVEAAVRIRSIRPDDPPCRSMLAGLDGAIRGVRWHAIPKEEREALWREYLARTHSAIDGYIAGFPAEIRRMLERIRALVRATVPEATETMAYGIPTFDLSGKHVVHFAGYPGHVGFYPTPSGIKAFAAELGPYKTGKGTARFPLDEPLPEDLIRRMVEFRVAEVG